MKNRAPAESESTRATTTATVQVLLQQLPNEQLVRRCQQGRRPERAAFTELVRRYQSSVDRLLHYLAPHGLEGADLAQEVWIRVYCKIKGLQEPTKFLSWLRSITTRLFYDALHRRKRAGSVVSLDAPQSFNGIEMSWELASPLPNPEEALATGEFYQQLRQALSELPTIFRTVIVLREIEDLPYEAIAQVTGVSLGTVKSRLARARHRLQQQLQPYGDR